MPCAGSGGTNKGGAKAEPTKSLRLFTKVTYGGIPLRAPHFHAEVKLLATLRLELSVRNDQHTERRIAKIAQQVTLSDSGFAITAAPAKIWIYARRQTQREAGVSSDDGAIRVYAFDAPDEIDDPDCARRVNWARVRQQSGEGKIEQRRLNAERKAGRHSRFGAPIVNAQAARQSQPARRLMTRAN